MSQQGQWVQTQLGQPQPFAQNVPSTFTQQSQQPPGFPRPAYLSQQPPQQFQQPLQSLQQQPQQYQQNYNAPNSFPNQNLGYPQQNALNPQNQPFNSQQPLNMQPNFNAMRQNQSSGFPFLDEDFSGLVEKNYEAAEMVKNILEEAETSCEIFKQRKIQIENDIKVLREENKLKQNNNDETSRAIGGQSVQFTQCLNEIENDFIDRVIEVRIRNTECIDKFTQLAKDFESNNCQLIKQIADKYRSIGIQNLEDKEYVLWMEVIKQSQLKLNVLLLYSEMIQKTIRIIQERHRDAQPNVISQQISAFEEEFIASLNAFN